MRYPLLLVCIAALLTGLLAFEIYKPAPKIVNIPAKRPAIAVRCSPDWNQLKEWLDETDIPPFPGTGNYTWRISTSNDSAQFYFNQGMRMYYCFHIVEAMASFKKAARFDPSCAMIYWAQALAYGPNINDNGYVASPDALLAVQRANERKASATQVENAFIEAMSVRYTADSADTNRKMLNEAYTAAMKKLFSRFPSNGDAGTLYADAMMLEHPWDLWKADGTPQPWTPPIRRVLEQVLRIAPANPGTNHYYIHVMEASPFAALALPSANKLASLTPGLSHTVHMPSHIYLRTGNYREGARLNEAAVAAYQQTIPLFQPVTGAEFLYLLHNQHMQVNHSMLAGRARYSDSVAALLKAAIPADYLAMPGALGNLLQYIHATDLLVQIRFEKWNTIAARTDCPPAAQVYGRLLWYFAKGMSAAHMDKTGTALLYLDSVKILSADPVLLAPYPPFSPASEGAKVARYMLEATIAEAVGKNASALESIRLAVNTEAAMTYNEPRDWLLNPRPYLGHLLLRTRQTGEAIKVYKEDLKVNAENGWSLAGLAQCYLQLGKAALAGKYRARAERAFQQADVKPHTD